MNKRTFYLERKKKVEAVYKRHKKTNKRNEALRLTGVEVGLSSSTINQILFNEKYNNVANKPQTAT